MGNLLQKGSPYLEDVNNLVNMASQMGLMDSILKNALPNATKCSTLQDIQASHVVRDRRVVIEFEDIYGVILIPAFGLGLALMAIILERALCLKCQMGN